MARKQAVKKWFEQARDVEDAIRDLLAAPHGANALVRCMELTVDMWPNYALEALRVVVTNEQAQQRRRGNRG